MGDLPEVAVGVELGCQILTAENQTERLVLFTAAPCTEDAARLEFLGVVGSETFATWANEVCRAFPQSKGSRNVRAEAYFSAVPASLATGKRRTGASLEATASDLHRAAAIDLAAQPEKWQAIPADGPVRELIASRTDGPIPSVHLSSVAGRLAVLAVVAEMAERAGSNQIGWRDDSLAQTARRLNCWVPNLSGPDIPPLATELPALSGARSVLSSLEDDDLAHLAGRAIESAKSCYWIFSGGESPRRAWHPWVAKQQGCFFTPRFVARHIARSAVRGFKEPPTVLDPAVGAGALLVEVFDELDRTFGSEQALRSLHGVDRDPALVELTALTLSFLAGTWGDERPDLLRTQFVTGDSLMAPLSGEASWGSWFPAILDAGGFGAVVMNPPYGQLKVNHSSLPARNGDNRAATAIRKRALEQARARVATTAAALRSHSDYLFAHGGVPDMPRFFVERAFSLLTADGRLACIVPSTFLADHRSRAFRHFLLDHHSVRELDLVPEDAHLFAGVNQPTCILIARAHRRTSGIRIRRRVLAASDLQTKADTVVNRELIARVDPAERRILNCGSEDQAILRTMHEHPRLDEHAWIVNLRGELDITCDSRFLRPRPPGVPLIRGDQIERFRTDLPSEKVRWVDHSFLFKRISPSKREHVSKQRIALRQCSYLRKPNRISGSLVDPGSVISNSCNFLAVEGSVASGLDPEESLLYLLGVINSRLIDWRFRMTSSTNHVGNYELDALPIPLPEPNDKTAEIVHLVRLLLDEPDHPSADDQLEAGVRSLYGL
jgi:Alw26I/Eco31I/Esp3I family type II restriction m6 adenine DNA methyltransferase